MRGRTALLLLLLAAMLLAPISALAKIVPTPPSVTLGSTEIGLVSIDCDGKTVTLVLSGFDGKLRIKNNKLVLTYQAYLIADGKTVKWKTGHVEGKNYIYTYKAKKLPDSILVFQIEDDFTGPYASEEIVLVDDTYIPVTQSVDFAGITLSMTTTAKIFKGKTEFTIAQEDLYLGEVIVLKGSRIGKSFFQQSKQAKTMLVVPVSFKGIQNAKLDPALLESLLAAKMSDGTALYDLWYNQQEACFVFDTYAYQGKALGMTVIDNVLTFGYTK